MQLGSTPNIIAIPDYGKTGQAGTPPAKVVNITPNPTNAPASSLTGTHLTFLGWAVFLIALYGLNHTGTGHELIYYSMVLIVLFLFIGNYNKILPMLTKGG